MKSNLIISILVALLALPASVLAFPPAPHHLIFGMVRDELGNPLTDENAQLIFETSAGVKLLTMVRYKGEPGQNYTLEVPMDAGITSDAYMATAMRPTVPFKIKVRIGNVTYLPIEMSGNFASLGQPGKKTRINLTLGEDSDGDGLPDAWERNLIAALGLNRTIADIKPGDDSDGDGMSNIDEYLAGTYAFDKADGFSLAIKSVVGNSTRLEFVAITGRTYSIHASADLTNWVQMPFQIEGAAAVMSWRADSVKTLQVDALSSESTVTNRFFKLMLQ